MCAAANDVSEPALVFLDMGGTRIADVAARGVKQADLPVAMGDGMSHSIDSMIKTRQNPPSFVDAAEAPRRCTSRSTTLAASTPDDQRRGSRILNCRFGGSDRPSARSPRRLKRHARSRSAS